MPTENPLARWGLRLFYLGTPLLYGSICCFLSFYEGIHPENMWFYWGIFIVVLGIVLLSNAVIILILYKGASSPIGVFRVFRHPIAVSYLLCLGGISLLNSTWYSSMFWVGFVLPITVIRMKVYEMSRVEDTAYQLQMKKVLFPF